jgi:hypothetical protein
MGERVREARGKQAWIVFLAFGILSIVAGVTMVAGVLPNPPSPESTTGFTLDQIEARVPGIGDFVVGFSRQLGNFMIAMGVLLATIAAGPYRRGERWAWYVCWIMPVLLIIQLANSFVTGGFLWQVDLASLLIVLVALFISYGTMVPHDRPMP